MTQFLRFSGVILWVKILAGNDGRMLGVKKHEKERGTSFKKSIRTRPVHSREKRTSRRKVDLPDRQDEMAPMKPSPKKKKVWSARVYTRRKRFNTFTLQKEGRLDTLLQERKQKENEKS